MATVVKIDTTKLTEQIRLLQKALLTDTGAADGREIMRQAGALLVRQCMQYSPPKSLAQGRSAVARDINHAVTVTTPEVWDSKAVKGVIERKDYDALNKILQRGKKGRNWRAERFQPTLHTIARDRRGRVQRERRVFTMDEKEQRRYVTLVQANVGRQKAGWLPALESLRGKMPPAWVLRHRSNRPSGSVNNQLAKPGSNFGVEVINHANGIGEQTQRVAQAVRAQVARIKRRIKLVLSGYNKDLARKIRITGRKAGKAYESASI